MILPASRLVASDGTDAGPPGAGSGIDCSPRVTTYAPSRISAPPARVYGPSGSRRKRKDRTAATTTSSRIKSPEIVGELPTPQGCGIELRRDHDDAERPDEDSGNLQARHPLPKERHHQDRDDDHVHVDQERGLRRGRQEDPLVLELESNRVNRTENPHEGLTEHLEMQATRGREHRQPEDRTDGHPREGQEQRIDRADREFAPRERGAPEDAREQDENHIPVAGLHLPGENNARIESFAPAIPAQEAEEV